MIILGLLLVAAAAVVTVEMVVANDGLISVHMWRWTWDVEAFWLVVAGAGILAAALLGLALLRAGGRRSRRLRRERRELAAESRDLAEENRRLAERADAAGPGRGAPMRGYAPATQPGPATQTSPAGRPVPVQPGHPDYARPAGRTPDEHIEGRHVNR
jgi:hypothetical protein